MSAFTFDEDEGSIEDSQPREFVEIKHGAIAHRMSCSDLEDKIYGNTYKPLPAGRGSIELTFIDQDKDLDIKLPVAHAFVQRYNRLCIPPKTITCTVYRKQLRSGEVKQIYYGLIESCSVDDGVATFKVPPVTKEAGRRRLPLITVGKECPYILYEAGCRAPRASFKVLTAVSHHDGAKITVGGIGGNPDHWADRGEFVHLPTGERMTISEQVGNLVTIQLPIFELADGDPVEVYAGCAHSTDDCRDKFDNLLNFGGEPHMPRGNIFLPDGYGVLQSE